MINKMLVRIKKILSDKDLVNTAINQLYRLVSGPLMLLFIPLYLTQEEQGYWYTFSSVAALAVFADLGFSHIILQFSAYEFAFLKFNNNTIACGDEIHLRKLADFFRFSVKYMFRMIGIVFPIIIFGGFYFINQNQSSSIDWITPWFIYSVFSGLVFANSCILGFLEGCNSVANIQKIRFIITLCTTLTVLTCLYFEFKLYALAFSLVISTLVGIYLIYKNYRLFIKQLLEISKVKFYCWKRDFYPLIWRYGISWCSGYFLLQLFVPLSFKFYGSIEAGKVGFSLAAWWAMFSISCIFLNRNLPAINMLISKKCMFEAGELLKDILKKCIFVFTILATVFLMSSFLLKEKIFLFERLLDYKILILLFFCNLIQLVITILATFLRAHKKEPMAFIFFIEAVIVSSSTLYIAMNHSIEMLFIGYILGSLFALIFAIYFTFIQIKEDRSIVL